MRYIKFFAVIIAMVLVAACSSNKTARLIPNHPYTKGALGMRGSVKYAVYSYYKNNYVAKAVRYDFSPEGLLTQMKTYEDGDSAVVMFEYDKRGMISKISGKGIEAYHPEVENGVFAGEVLSVNNGGNVTTTVSAYQYDDSGVISKEYDKESSDTLTKRYVRGVGGAYDLTMITYADGRYDSYVYNADGRLTSIESYNSKGRNTRSDNVTAEYDQQGNIVKYNQKHGRKGVLYYKVSYQYYSADEAGSAVRAGKADNAAEDNTTSSYDDFDEEYARPNGVIMWILIGLFLLILAGWLGVANDSKKDDDERLFANFWGEEDNSGMRKLWFYNKEPYIKTGKIFLITICSFLAAIIVLLVFGGVVWGVFWLIKIILWAIIIIGWIMLVGGVIALFGREGAGCLPLIFGALVVAYQEKLEEWGEMFVAWGETTLDSVNLLDWLVAIYHVYGTTIAVVIAAPFACFAALALLLIIVSQILRFVEFVVMKIYRANRPCPHCGSTDEFEYVVDGKPHPVPLHPGVYGIFHQTNRKGTSVPTMLLNGKARLTRRCNKCGEYTNQTGDSVIGTDVHIGVVGERSSGKSYMLYSALSLLQERLAETFDQVDADRNNEITTIMERVNNQDGIQTQVKNRYKAIQMRLKMKLRPMPYHMFFYDVAGEMFNIESQENKSAMEFYINVKSIIYVIDPTNVDCGASGMMPSEQFIKWQDERYRDTEKYSAESTISRLKTILENNGRDTKDIALYVVCVKKDLGYFGTLDYSQNPSAGEVKQFVCDELGLRNLDNTLESSFKSVDYTAVSVINDNKDALYNLFVKVFKQNGISVG